jgi:hypothetical protein
MTFHSPINRNILSEIPKRPMGKPARGSEAIYRAKLKAWADEILKLQSRMDFGVSSRGWGYILEEWGALTKDDFDASEAKISECRKAGLLPLNICVEDRRRLADGLEDIDDRDAIDYAEAIFKGVDREHHNYCPVGFWDDKKYYIETCVEKIDLKSLFGPLVLLRHKCNRVAGGRGVD